MCIFRLILEKLFFKDLYVATTQIAFIVVLAVKDVADPIL